MRKLMMLVVGVTLLALEVLAGPALGQVKQNDGQSATAQLDFWLKSLESSGFKIESAKVSSDSVEDSATISDLALTFSSKGDAPKKVAQYKIGKLTFKSLAATDKAIAFSSLVAEKIDIGEVGAPPAARFLVDRLEVVDGNIPTAAGFAPDPRRPFTARISFLRVLTSTKIASAKVSGVSIGGMTFAQIGMEGVAGGKIASSEMSGFSASAAEGADDVETVKTIRLTNLNLDPFIKMFEDSAYLEIGAARPWRSVLDELSVEGFKLVDGDTTVTADLGSIGPIFARQFDENLLALFDKAALDPQFAKNSPDDFNRLTAAVREAFKVDAIKVQGIHLSSPNKAGQFEANLTSVALAGLTFKHVDSVEFTGLGLVDPTGNVNVDKLILGDVNVPEFAASDLVNSSPDARKQTLGATQPRIGRFYTDGVKAKVKDVEFSVDKIDLNMQFFIGAVPTNISLVVDHVKMSLEDIPIVAVKSLLSELGYDKIDLSAKVVGAWQDSGTAIAFNTISVQGADMGTVTLSGSITGISRKSFEDPRVVFPLELISGGLQNFRLSYEDQSLFARLLAEVGKKNKLDVAELKRNLSANMPRIMSSIQVPDIRNKFVFAAISFINDPKILEISASTSDITPLKEVASMLNEPAKLPVLLKLDASANDRK